MAKKLETLKAVRLEKLKKMKDLGINPYPSKLEFPREIVSRVIQKLGETVSVAGRILGWRGHGNVIFADLEDESGKIQLFFQKKNLSENFKLLDLVDVGDFIAARGMLIKTVAGEISIDVENFQFLVKTQEPLPSMWYGLKDVEERYRKRYLDTILNGEVKKRLTSRSKIIDSIRDVLTNKDFMEVETPTLQPIYGGGFARPFSTHHNALDSDFYLRISDEMYLKRLVVGGFEKVFEITKVFRNEGVDYDHNPEFTMFEAMIAYEDYTYGMDLIEEIIESAAIRIVGKTDFDYQETNISVKRPWARLKLVEAVKKYTNMDPLVWKSIEEAKESIKNIGIGEEKIKDLNSIQSVGECIAFAFEEFVEEKLIQPTIIYDYPIEVSPLAKKCDDPRFTQRFEMFAFGSELGNNYTELNDPQDLYKRFVEEKKREKAGFEEAHQTDYDYLEAIEHGLPPTCGIAIGIDRLVMLLTDAKSIKEVIPFPTLKPKNENKISVKRDSFGKEILNNDQLPDEDEYKFYAIVRKDIEIGHAMNALGHASIGLAGGSGLADKMWFLKYQDNENGIHPNISHYNYVVLKADNSKEISKVRSEAIKKGIVYTDFTSSMTIGKSIDQMNMTKNTPESDLDYYAIVLFGKTKEIKEFTSKFSLFK